MPRRSTAVGIARRRSAYSGPRRRPAKLLGLDASQGAHALGIALSFASGSRQCILDGALTKRLQAGQAARDGLLSAMLAVADGFTGTAGTFAGRFGFFELYQPNGYSLAPLTDELGRAFRGDEVSFKPYPCGRPLHALLDAAIDARNALGIASAADVANISVTLDATIFREQFEGGAHRARPTQIVEAQFALPFLVAVALVRGRLCIEDVGRIDDPEVTALAARIGGQPAGVRPRDWARIAVRHKDGRVVERETEVPLGSPARPLTGAQSAAKFRDCAANAAVRLAPADVDRCLERLTGLED